MIDFNKIMFFSEERTNYLYQGKYSLECHLEVIVGGYYLYGSPDDWQYVYWNISEEDFKGILSQDKIIVLLNEKYSFAVVRQEYLEQFKMHTEGYALQYYSVSDLYDEVFFCREPQKLPDEYRRLLWIDDDFLNDENIPFDFEAFEVIDEGNNYLNPKHFSVMQLTKTACG